MSHPVSESRVPPTNSPGTAVTRPGRRQRLQPWLLAIALVGLGFTAWSFRDIDSMAQAIRRSGPTQSGPPPRNLPHPFKTFDLTRSEIPADKIRHGGPMVDGIPALSKLTWLAPDQATYLKPEDRVVGVTVGTTARAYPLRILDYHEIVNDRVGDAVFAVTYCPLCDSAIVYDRVVDGKPLEFGVSGLLYNSNVLLYDRQKAGAASLWSQLRHASISGPRKGQALRMLPFEIATWSSWRDRFPATTVLSPETEFPRDYSRSPYGGYFTSPDLMFPVDHHDDRLPRKAEVLGVWTPNSSVAFSLPDLRKSADHDRITTAIDGEPLELAFDRDRTSLRVIRAPEGAQWLYAFWFAWAAFHPDTTIHGQQD